MDAEKSLGNNIFLEVEEDDDKDFSEEVSLDYSCQSILESIGEKDFKQVYTLLGPEVKQSSIQFQIIFCRSILQKIEEVYNYSKEMDNTDFLGKLDILEIYVFLEFLEYDHISFLVDLCTFIKVDPLKVDIPTILEIHKDYIDKFCNSYQSPKLVSKFIRTYNWNDLYKYLVKIIEQSRTEISIEMSMRGEKTNV
jgi:hypothetical protein